MAGIPLTRGIVDGSDAHPVSPPAAGWWSRLVASAVDAVLVALAGYGLILIIYALHGYATTHVHGRAETVLTVHELWPFAIAWLLYATGLQRRVRVRNGETLGKAAMHIRVVRRDGKPVDLVTGLLREGVGKALPLLCGTITLPLSALAVLYIALDCLWPLRDREGRALHDRLARTRVVRSDTLAPTP